MADSPHQPDASPPSGVFDVPDAAQSPTSFSSLTATAETAAYGPVERPGGARPWIVAGGIAAAFVVSLIAIGILYYKWYRTDEHQTTIVVWAEPEWEGATVTVSGGGLPTQLSKKLTPDDKLVIRFHVPPGNYSVRINKDGRLIAERITDRPLTEEMIWWPFRQRLPDTQAGPQ